MENRKCKWCGKFFTPKVHNHFYCCWKHQYEAALLKANERYHGKMTFSCAVKEKTPIIEKREYMSDLDEFRRKKRKA